MSEIFEREHGNRTARLPSAGTTSVDSGEIGWQETGVAGFLVKPLLEDAASGQRTWLMKVEPGAHAPLHRHDELEQIFVLEGSFYDQERTWRQGDYAVRAPGTDHTAGSEEGATVLLVYSRPAA